MRKSCLVDSEDEKSSVFLSSWDNFMIGFIVSGNLLSISFSSIMTSSSLRIGRSWWNKNIDTLSADNQWLFDLPEKKV